MDVIEIGETFISLFDATQTGFVAESQMSEDEQ